MKQHKTLLLCLIAILLFAIGLSLKASVVNAAYDFLEVTGLSNPPSGNGRLYVDSGTNLLTCLLSTGSSCIPGHVAWSGVASGPGFQNGWTDLDSGFQIEQYGADGTGKIYLRGVLVIGSITDGNVLFTLPSGYRPSTEQFIQSAAESFYITQLNIQTNGNVQWNNVGNTNVTVGQFMPLYFMFTTN